MAASENPIVGVDLKLQYDGSLIGTQTGGSLSVSPDVQEIILKNTGGGTPTDWKGRLSGVKEWEVSHEGLVLNGSDEYDNSTSNAELKLDATADSTTNHVTIPTLESIDLTLTQEMEETGGLDDQLWRYIRPAEREFSIDITGSYYDFNSSTGAVYDDIWNAMDSGRAVASKLTVFDKEFTGDVVISDFSLDASTGGEGATIDLSLQSKDSLTTGGTAFGTGVDNIFQSFMNKSTVDVGMLHYSGGSTNSGATKITGTGYFTEVSLSASRGDALSCSTTVAGDGPISTGTIS